MFCTTILGLPRNVAAEIARQQARDDVVTAARTVAHDQIDLPALVEIFHRRLGARGRREDARGAQQGNNSPGRELAPASTPHAATAPNRSRFVLCCSLRGGSLNKRAALPPRMLCLAFSDRNGRSQIRLGRSKSQWG